MLWNVSNIGKITQLKFKTFYRPSSASPTDVENRHEWFLYSKIITISEMRVCPLRRPVLPTKHWCQIIRKYENDFQRQCMHLQKYDNASFSLLLRGALVKSYHTIYCFYQLHITYLLTVKSLEYIILMHNHAMQLNVTVM